jgi:hypothetical protein
MKTLIIKDGNGASEIFQAVDIKFAFCHKDGDSYTQLHKHIKCRDFLGDVIWSKCTGKKAAIWGFSYDWKTNPYDDDKLILSLKFPNQGVEEIFVDNFHHLNDKEMQANTNKSSLFKTDKELYWIIEADKAWQSNIWKISLYTFFIKLLSYKTIEVLESPEDKYLKKYTPVIEAKCLSKVTTEFKETLWDNMEDAHNNSGFISIIEKNNKEMYKLILGE